MQLKVQQGTYVNGEVATAEDITYIVVFGDDGTPIMAIEQVGRDHIQVTKANESTFPMILRRFGIDAGGVTV